MKLKKRSQECSLKSPEEIVDTVVGKKTSGDFGDMEDENELALLEEELIQLTVKGSLVVPSENTTLICSVWTRKTYNPNSLKAQLRSIWKTKKKFEILVTGQNLFIISFEDEDDLEHIMEGRPWFFQQQLIIFDRLLKSVERNKIRLVYSLFWLKFGSCPPECDKKDLMHALDPLFRVFLFLRMDKEKSGSLSNMRISRLFLFGCGRLGHGVKDYTEIPSGDRVKVEDDLPYSLGLKAESSIIGKESLLFGSLMKRTMKQCYYTGVEATNKDEGFSPNSTKQIHRMVKEGYSEKNYNFLETVKMR
ncbi:hypothetical protein Gohar_020158 [Gossypium harknessii]|uniref:DUF4283 domain-containing protein n=1 Tax=Gossypium harknessii TaxID=34285 RepID=A0A7J9HWT2_9ROSI|nr:hypothetical protein [Gossypium harknessii]